MSTTNRSKPQTDSTTNSLAAHFRQMDGHYQEKYSSSIGSNTMATLLGSLADDDHNCDEHLPHDLNDFSCTSMDFAELLEAEESQQQQQQQQWGGKACLCEEPFESFHESYDLGKSLGEGAFGTVHRCYELSPNGKRNKKSFAVKAVPMDMYDHEELEILGELMDCPTITQVREVFYEDDQAYIVMEEMKGGELLERVSKKECYKEMEAKLLLRTLLQTIQFCHSRGISHCDIKPENILLKYKDNDTDIQLADFGLSKRFVTPDGRRKQLFDMNGSAEYAAPEVFNRPEDDDIGYDERCDIWSCGVVLYVLLAGYCPFDGEDAYETICKVGQGKFKFHKHYWKNISMDAKILIVKMLQVNPDERCTVEEALESPWFDDVRDEADDQEQTARCIPATAA